MIKGGSSHEIHKSRGLRLQVWQPGFHEESVRDSSDYQRKAEYIRMNPVRTHMVNKPEDWMYGSATRRFIIDPVPERLSVFTSAAKAAAAAVSHMSDLKVRPPKNPQTPGLKSRLPELLVQTTAEPESKSRPNETSVRSAGEGLKSRPPEPLVRTTAEPVLKSRPPERKP